MIVAPITNRMSYLQKQTQKRQEAQREALQKATRMRASLSNIQAENARLASEQEAFLNQLLSD